MNGEWSNSVTITYPARTKGSKGEEPPTEEPPKEEPPKERPKKERPPKEPPVEEPHGEEPPAEEPEEEELPELPFEEHPGSFFVGLNGGYWGSSEPGDSSSVGTVVRLDTPPKLTPWEAVGLKVIADMSGPYSNAGVSGLNHQAYVQRVVNFVRANPHVYAIEVLNEPGGNWFWGSSSESPTNRESYAQLLIEVHEALVVELRRERARWSSPPGTAVTTRRTHGAKRGRATRRRWPTSTASRAIPTAAPAAAPARSSATGAWSKRPTLASQKPVYITEVGFPTKGPTGDSLQYTEVEQAWAMFQFAQWARSTGYVAGVTFYGYRDGTEGGGYGVETHAGRQEARLHRAPGSAGKPALHDLRGERPRRATRRARRADSGGARHRDRAASLSRKRTHALVLGRRELSGGLGQIANELRHSRSRRAWARDVLRLPSTPMRRRSPSEHRPPAGEAVSRDPPAERQPRRMRHVRRPAGRVQI